MTREHIYFVYILASRARGTLYVGVTNNLLTRITHHKNGDVEGFTKTYNVNRLVHHEEFGDIEQAILREKRLKRWRRKWKIELIEEQNPDWIDLYPRLCL